MFVGYRSGSMNLFSEAGPFSSSFSSCGYDASVISLRFPFGFSLAVIGWTLIPSLPKEFASSSERGPKNTPFLQKTAKASCTRKPFSNASFEFGPIDGNLDLPTAPMFAPNFKS